MAGELGKRYFQDFGSGAYASGRKFGAGPHGSIEVNVHFTKNLSELFDEARLSSIYAVSKAIDEVGNKVKTQVIRSVARQAGVKYGAVRNVIFVKQAMGEGSGKFVMVARDATLSLKEFGPRQTRAGVSAAPWGKRRVFPHTFIGPNGHVFARAMNEGKRVGRKPIYKLFGPNIPKEMVKDEAEKTFYRETKSCSARRLKNGCFGRSNKSRHWDQRAEPRARMKGKSNEQTSSTRRGRNAFSGAREQRAPRPIPFFLPCERRAYTRDQRGVRARPLRSAGARGRRHLCEQRRSPMRRYLRSRIPRRSRQ